MDGALLPIVLGVAGFGAGVVNALAGGGSFLTFPLLLWLGVPPQVANATNRIAITAQCIAGTATYARHGVVHWRKLAPLYLPACAGAFIGAQLASNLDETIFRRVTAVVLLAVAASVFIDTKRWTEVRPEGGHVRPLHYPLVFAMGIYGGFLQVGIGTLMLTFFVMLGGFDVVRGNAMKFGLVAGYQILALVIFTRASQIDWVLGGMLTIGTILGGIVGANIVVQSGTRWVRWVVIVAALAGVAKLLLG